MRASRRWVVVALAPAGAVAGHVLGYVMAGRDASLHGSHSHLGPAAWVAAAAGAVALAVLAIARPAAGRGALRLGSLVTAQVVAFGLIEAGEHLVAGHGVLSFVLDPSFRWGVVAQVLSGGLLVLASRLARASGARIRAALARRRSRQPAVGFRGWSLVPFVPPVRLLVSSVSERGPPGLLTSA